MGKCKQLYELALEYVFHLLTVIHMAWIARILVSANRFQHGAEILGQTVFKGNQACFPHTRQLSQVHSFH